MYKLIVILFICSSGLSAQTASGVWGTLSMVTIEKTYDPEFGMETLKTDINPIVQSLNGKTISLEGYIIPITGQITQNHFMFSRFPQNMCFFCGKAGPESAMQVFLKDNKTVAFTSDKISLEGRLKIYDDQSSGLIYTLEEAEVK